MRPFYALHAGAYDQLITDPVEPWVDAVHDSLGRSPALILDAGCGTGRHAAALVARGHRVDLVDASPELLAQAIARCPTARAREADLCTMDTQPIYDTVTCRGVLNDLITDGERRSALRSLAGSLVPGGRLFLDVREEGASRARADGVARTKQAESLTFVSRTTWSDGLLHVDETYERAGSVQRYHFTMRPWAKSELREALGECGLHDVRIGAGVGRRTPDRLFVVARLGEETPCRG